MVGVTGAVTGTAVGRDVQDRDADRRRALEPAGGRHLDGGATSTCAVGRVEAEAQLAPLDNHVVDSQPVALLGWEIWGPLEVHESDGRLERVAGLPVEVFQDVVAHVEGLGDAGIPDGTRRSHVLVDDVVAVVVEIVVRGTREAKRVLELRGDPRAVLEEARVLSHAVVAQHSVHARREPYAVDSLAAVGIRRAGWACRIAPGHRREKLVGMHSSGVSGNGPERATSKPQEVSVAEQIHGPPSRGVRVELPGDEHVVVRQVDRLVPGPVDDLDPGIRQAVGSDGPIHLLHHRGDQQFPPDIRSANTRNNLVVGASRPRPAVAGLIGVADLTGVPDSAPATHAGAGTGLINTRL